MPALAQWAAMPLPITPAPSTATRRIGGSARGSRHGADHSAANAAVYRWWVVPVPTEPAKPRRSVAGLVISVVLIAAAAVAIVWIVTHPRVPAPWLGGGSGSSIPARSPPPLTGR